MHKITQLIRTTCYLTLPVVTGLVALFVLIAQFKEIGTNSEILPLSSFVVLISLSGLAFNWCRVSSSFTTEALLQVIYRAGIDLFLASLLAIVSAALAFIRTLWPAIPTTLNYTILTLHWVFLALSMLLFVIAILSILTTARKIQTGQH